MSDKPSMTERKEADELADAVKCALQAIVEHPNDIQVLCRETEDSIDIVTSGNRADQPLLIGAKAAMISAISKIVRQAARHCDKDGTYTLEEPRSGNKRDQSASIPCKAWSQGVFLTICEKLCAVVFAGRTAIGFDEMGNTSFLTICFEPHPTEGQMDMFGTKKAIEHVLSIIGRAMGRAVRVTFKTV